MLYFRFLVVLLILVFSYCKGDKNAYNDKLGALLGISPAYSPTIFTISPQRGAPEIKNENVYYPSTNVKITGKNFSFLPSDLVVTFNGIPATIDYSSEQEIYTKIPAGASTGLLMIRRFGGVCTSFDGKSGNNCIGKDFYIDCYSSFNAVYGQENLVKLGELTKIEYESNGTKAFRVDLPQGNYTLNVSCASAVIVQRFSNSCVSTTEVRDGSSLLINPQIPITGGYTMQFFLTTTKGNCTIGVFN